MPPAVSHEANHVTLQLRKRIGVQDDEVVCYTQDNLLGELLRKTLTQKNRRKKAS